METTQEQQEALATLKEWRDAIKEAIKTNEFVNENTTLLMTFIGISVTMSQTLNAFTQDLETENTGV